MPIVKINGASVNFPDGLSPQELESQVAAAAQAMSKQAPEPVSTAPKKPLSSSVGFVENAKDQLKQGLTDTGSLLGVIGAPFRGIATLAQGKGFMTGVNESLEGGAFLKDQGDQALGTVGYEADSNLGKLGNAALRAIPGLAGGGTGIVTAGKEGLKAVVKKEGAKRITVATAAPLTHALLLNTAAGAGAEGARQTAEGLGGGAGWQAAASLVGGVGAGLTAGKAVATAAPKGIERVMQMANKINPMLMAKLGFSAGEQPGVAQMASALGGKALDTRKAAQLNQMESAYAAKSGGSIADDLEASAALQRRAGVSNPSVLGVDSPELNAMAQRASVSPEFRGSLEAQITEAQGALLSKLNKEIGSEATLRDTIEGLEPKAFKVSELSQKSGENLSRLLGKIGDDVAAKSDADGSLGTKIRDLNAKMEGIAKAEVSPLYDKAIKGATERGEVMPPEVTSRLKETLENDAWKALGDSDPFLASKIRALDAAVERGQGLLPEQFDSFKTAINGALTKSIKNNNAGETRLLNQVKDKFLGTKNAEGIRENGAIHSVSDQFAKEMGEADEAYKTTVAGFFKVPTLSKINKADYDEKIPGLVAAGPTAIRATLKALGPDGTHMVEAALLRPLRKLLEEGKTITPEVLTKFKGTYGEHLEALPGLQKYLGNAEDAVTKSVAADAQFKMEYNRLRNSEKQITTPDGRIVERDPLVKAVGSDAVVRAYRNAPDLIKSLKNDAELARRLEFTYKDEPKGIEAIRNYTLQLVAQEERPLVALADIMKANPTMKRLLTNHMETYGGLLGSLQNLNKANPPKVSAQSIKELPKDAAEAATGLSYKGYFDVIRSKLASTTQKIGTIAGKITESKASKQLADYEKGLLMDVDGLVMLLRASEKARKAAATKDSGKLKSAMAEAEGVLQGARSAFSTTAKEKALGGAVGVRSTSEYVTEEDQINSNAELLERLKQADSDE
jgi:hypothetical protein